MRGRRVAFALLLLAVAALTVGAAGYLFVGESVYFPEQRAVFLARQGVLLAHVGGAAVALLCAPWLPTAGVRRRPRLHRRLGRTYLAGSLVGGLGGLALAPTAFGGAVSGAGFGALAVAWLATGGLGLAAARRGDLAAHRRWMVRSLALTYAALTLRLYLGLYGAASAAGLVAFGFEQAYRGVAWVCWVPNLAVAWWLTRRPRARELPGQVSAARAAA